MSVIFSSFSQNFGIIKNAIAPSAQSERRGGAGPVRSFLDG
jgi:hypothetical protein